MNTFWDKYGMTVLSALSMGLNLTLMIVSQKRDDIKMKEAAAECFKEMLENQAKES